jgi:transcriptional regulator with XRE-family HTH domain
MSKSGELRRMIIDVVKASRKARGIKQSVFAKALSMTECNYCKIEKHYKELTTGQLSIIADLLDTSVRKIITLAEALSFMDLQNESLESHIVSFQKNCTYSLIEDYKNDNLILILSNMKQQRMLKHSSHESITGKTVSIGTILTKKQRQHFKHLTESKTVNNEVVKNVHDPLGTGGSGGEWISILDLPDSGVDTHDVG